MGADALRRKRSAATPLDEIDVSRPEIFADGSWRHWFARLREDAPVHYCANAATGPFWSVTRHADIKAVDTDHRRFSSELGGITIADVPPGDEVRLDNFIAMDEPTHSAQRRTVSPSVVAANLARMEPLIRERVVDILDNLPVGETVQLGRRRVGRTDGTHARHPVRLPLRRAPQAHLLVRTSPRRLRSSWETPA